VTPLVKVPSTDGTRVGLIESPSISGLLASYGLEQASTQHISTSENVTFSVSMADSSAILRIYRIGHRTRAAIEAELSWMDALREEAVVSTPKTRQALDGERIGAVETSIGPAYCALFELLPGGEPAEDQLEYWFTRLGVLCARLHNHGSLWQPRVTLDRPQLAWRTLIGEEAVWGPWARAPGLDPNAGQLLGRVAARIRNRVQRYGVNADRYGLIHGDLRLQNLLVDRGQVHVIDFDDCCFCWRLYDLATALSLIEDLRSAPALLDAWLAGYQTCRPLGREDLDIVADLVMMRRLQVLGWLGSRSQSELALQVAPQYVPATVAAADDYLSGMPRLKPTV
jgi:Ser/Thr protein kinase RdoA (MazF antagonist)